MFEFIADLFINFALLIINWRHLININKIIKIRLYQSDMGCYLFLFDALYLLIAFYIVVAHLIHCPLYFLFLWLIFIPIRFYDLLRAFYLFFGTNFITSNFLNTKSRFNLLRNLIIIDYLIWKLCFYLWNKLKCGALLSCYFWHLNGYGMGDRITFVIVNFIWVITINFLLYLIYRLSFRFIFIFRNWFQFDISKFGLR